MIKEVQNIEEVIDFSWRLSQDNLYASYPREKSIKGIEYQIKRAINEDNRKIISCYNENILCGVCIYFWEVNEKYAQTTQFLIADNFNQTAKEIIDYISKQLGGYELLIGIPLSNENANQYFINNNIECIESSIVTSLYNLKQHYSKNYDCIYKIDRENFDIYAIFHDKHAIPLGMYYNSRNLKKDIDHFKILAFKENKEIHASILTKNGKDLSDIIGLFVDKEYKNKGIEDILINELLSQLYNEFGTINEILYFINEECVDELNLVLKAGFKIKEKYRCYRYIFKRNESI